MQVVGVTPSGLAQGVVWSPEAGVLLYAGAGGGREQGLGFANPF